MEKEYNELNETERVLRSMFTASRRDSERLAKGDKILMKFNKTIEDAQKDEALMEEYDYDLAMKDSLFNKEHKEGFDEGEQKK